MNHLLRPVTPLLLVAALAGLACGPGGAAPEGSPSGSAADAKAAKPAAAGGGAPRGGKAMPVEVAPVEARELSYQIVSVGSLEASDVISVTARVVGVAEKVSFREGDRVDPDRILVEIEPERFRLASAQAEANQRRAEATQREAEAALAKREKLREKDAGWVSAEELMSLQSRLDVAKAEVAQAKASAELAELNLRYSFVKAGAAGEIQKRLVQPGQYVTAGTVLANLVRTDPLFLRFQVSEREAPSLAKGTEATFAVRADPALKHKATLVHVADSADPKTRRVECLARVDGDPAGLRPGYFAEITIVSQGTRTVPVIPEGALRPTDKGFVVYVVKDGKAEERIVEAGLSTEDGFIEVRSGVAAGESLVTRGAHYLRPGADVDVKAP